VDEGDVELDDIRAHERKQGRRAAVDADVVEGDAQAGRPHALH